LRTEPAHREAFVALPDYILAESLAWRGQPCPVLMFCFTSPRCEQAARRALAAARESGSVRIATTAIDPGVTSPAGPVWLPLLNREPGQLRLAALDAALPDPWQQYRDQRAREERAKQAREQALRAAEDDEDGPLS
jgi:hypothetical protein